MKGHAQHDAIRSLDDAEIDSVSGAAGFSVQLHFFGMKLTVDGYNGVTTLQDSKGCVTTVSPTYGSATYCGGTKVGSHPA
jgi:hypothetical protein